MFKVNNKDTRTMLIASYWCLYCYLWIYFTPCSSFSIVTFAEVKGKKLVGGPFLPPPPHPSWIGDRFTKMESELLVNEQYSRRECLEILEIPDSIPNNNLEETVLKIFNETGVTVNSRDIKACHHLNQKANPKK